MFFQDGPIVLATVSSVIIWLLDVSEKENRSYHAESRELNLPLVYVCRLSKEKIFTDFISNNSDKNRKLI